MLFFPHLWLKNQKPSPPVSKPSTRVLDWLPGFRTLFEQALKRNATAPATGAVNSAPRSFAKKNLKKWTAGTEDCIHPPRLTWNLKMMVWKMFLLFQGCILRFHVNLAWCKWRCASNNFPLAKRWSSGDPAVKSFRCGTPTELWKKMMKMFGSNRPCKLHLNSQRREGSRETSSKPLHSLKLTASSHLKIGRLPQKETKEYSNHPFSGVNVRC